MAASTICRTAFTSGNMTSIGISSPNFRFSKLCKEFLRTEGASENI